MKTKKNYNVHKLNGNFLRIQMQKIFENNLLHHLPHPWIGRNYFFCGGPQDVPQSL